MQDFQEYYVWTKEAGHSSADILSCMIKALPQILEAELTDTQRAYAELRYEKFWGLKEIADEYGVDISTVCRTLARARARVKTALEYVQLGARLRETIDDI